MWHTRHQCDCPRSEVQHLSANMSLVAMSATSSPQFCPLCLHHKAGICEPLQIKPCWGSCGTPPIGHAPGCRRPRFLRAALESASCVLHGPIRARHPIELPTTRSVGSSRFLSFSHRFRHSARRFRDTRASSN